MAEDKNHDWEFGIKEEGHTADQDTDGNVILPQKPGLGFDLNWDYINDNLI